MATPITISFPSGAHVGRSFVVPSSMIARADPSGTSTTYKPCPPLPPSAARREPSGDHAGERKFRVRESADDAGGGIHEVDRRLALPESRERDHRVRAHSSAASLSRLIGDEPLLRGLCSRSPIGEAVHYL
jgi:hypothetical protein